MPAAVADEYAAWLADGHVDAVVREGGALWGKWERGAEASDGTVAVKSIYLFPSQAAYDAYVSEVAPRMRADGLRRFGPDSGKGVTFERRTELVAAEC